MTKNLHQPALTFEHDRIMFTKFGHILSVILIRSSEYPSFFVNAKQGDAKRQKCQSLNVMNDNMGHSKTETKPV